MSLRRYVLLASLSLSVTFSASPVSAADAAAGGITSLYSQLQWRLVGPFRGGWSSMAEGVPSQPNVFYFGAVDGGLWKSVDAGLTWKPQFQQGGSISVGALAIAPSDPNILYIGTGQPEQSRYDVVDGDGVYRSDDGGETWKSVGLKDSRHIGRIWVDPKNPDVVVVAVLGHVFGPNEERGVFRSEDGGAHWTKTLYVDADTGAVDLATDPSQPGTMFAATWQGRSWPWLSYFMPQAGPGSGIWKSGDAGKTWTRLSNGLPAGPLGRIGLAVAPGSGAQRVYALIEAKDDDKSGLYRSDDGGANWKGMGSGELTSGYFERLAVDPKDPDTLYVMNRSVAQSRDGGKSFKWFKGAPGGDDYHFLWINPQDDRYMVVTSDQGTAVTVDAGKSWSPWYNQPTGQFYHVTTDNRFPYHIYSGQQDSGTVETESASDFGEISFREWHPVGGDERSYVVPDPVDPAIVYVGGLGGHISRYDDRTHQVQNISATPLAGYARQPTTVKDRYTWFYPVVADPRKGHTLYVGSQYLYKTSDGGMHWKPISGDLTGPDPKRASGCDGTTSFTLEQARYCGFGAIFSIAPSPLKEGVLWVGTDDGLVQLSRNGGKKWQDVTPPGMPFYGRVNQVEASPTDPGTAFVAVDIHRQDKFQPFIFKTHDYGQTWDSIVDGIPADQFVYVVRQDPKDARLLYAGTNAGVYVSFDEGDHWQPLQGGLPNVRIRDLTVHGDDLIAATHGRGIWVLDDVAPLRRLDASLARTSAHLFEPAVAIRVRRNENKDTPLPPEVSAAPNPPEGAVFDYWLGKDLSGPVTLAVYDARGRLVRSFASDAQSPQLKTEPYFTDAWLAAPEQLDGTPGAHRFVWDLRYPRPPALEYDYSIAAVFEKGGAVLPQGALVLPGSYTVRLTAGGKTLSQSFKVTLDPRVSSREAKKALPQQLALEQQMDAALARSYAAHESLKGLRTRLAALKTEVAADADLQKQVADLDAKAEQLADKAPKHTSLAAINGAIVNLVNEVDDGDRSPPAQYRKSFDDYRKALDDALQHWDELRLQDLAALNAALTAKGHAEVEM